MSYEIEKSFLALCDQSSCILVFNLDFECRDTVLSLDMDINIEDFKNSYWGRPCNDGYSYQVCRV